tara:strand:- start:836 stop:1120 length:285 start_codon:yes stop_codon:yes gene_type:complete
MSAPSDFKFNLCRLIEGMWNRTDVCPQLDAKVLAEHLDMSEGDLSDLVDAAIKTADDGHIGLEARDRRTPEDLEEIQRRDEKNGLYPHWWDDSN